jgi:hypothetical protein
MAFNGKITISELARLTNLSRPTLYKYVEEYAPTLFKERAENSLCSLLLYRKVHNGSCYRKSRYGYRNANKRYEKSVYYPYGNSFFNNVAYKISNIDTKKIHKDIRRIESADSREQLK